MSNLGSEFDLRQFRHDARQPLNVIQLTVENLRNRLKDQLSEESAIYLENKLKRIAQQVDRLSVMIDEAPVKAD